MLSHGRIPGTARSSRFNQVWRRYDEPAENIAGWNAEIDREEGLRFEFAFGVTDEKPADRHRRHAGAIPHGGAGGDFNEAIGSAVPATDTVALPRDFAILDDR